VTWCSACFAVVAAAPAQLRQTLGLACLAGGMRQGGASCRCGLIWWRRRWHVPAHLRLAGSSCWSSLAQTKRAQGWGCRQRCAVRVHFIAACQHLYSLMDAAKANNRYRKCLLAHFSPNTAASIVHLHFSWHWVSALKRAHSCARLPCSGCIFMYSLCPIVMQSASASPWTHMSITCSFSLRSSSVGTTFLQNSSMS